MAEVGVCVDTSVIIEYLRGREPYVSSVQGLVEKDFAVTTSVNVFELGLGTKRTKREKILKILLDSIPVFPFDFPAAKKAIRIQHRLRRKNQEMGYADTMIASICLINNFSLYTQNIKHFKRVESLSLFGV